MKSYTGINIQFPISKDILSGEKVIETRTYKLPKHYLNQEMAMIETPGKNGNFKARVVAIIRFTECFLYQNKEEFYLDIERHLVSKDSVWAWKEKPKYGWKVEIVKIISPPVLCTRHGIIYRTNIQLKE